MSNCYIFQKNLVHHKILKEVWCSMRIQKLLNWSCFGMPPKSSGGTVVSNYIVEHKTVKTEWSSANHESVNGTRFALPMKESETYTVRVRAVNSLGRSEPSKVITIKLDR